jgi:tetratricopeptide (TPR) repeat protein
MGILSHDEILILWEAAIGSGLAESRAALLVGISPALVQSLPHAPTAGAQILRDLDEMNNAGALADGSVPLVAWLKTASMLVRPRQHAAVFDDALSKCTLAGATRYRSAPLAPVTAPPIPPHYVPPENTLTTLRGMLTEDPRSRRTHLTVIAGLGGLGKTALAAAACHDPVVRGNFPDGIVWLRLGRIDEVDVISRIRDLGRSLGDFAAYYDSLQSATARLRMIIPGKTVLIVLDDVWSASHVMPFLVEAPSAHVLLTTRDITLGPNLGSRPILLRPLETHAARTLLCSWAGHNDPEYDRIIQQVGGLPLALKIIGARLAAGFRPADWQQSFRHMSELKTHRRAADPHENLELCFEQSANQLPDDERVLFYSLGVMSDNLALIPIGLVIRLWRSINSGISARDCRDLIDELAQFALVDVDRERDTLSLHDLIRLYVRAKLEPMATEIHRKFLRSYGLPGSDWSDSGIDEYLAANLAHHMIGAEQVKALCDTLTSSPRWLLLQRSRFDGDAVYLADVRRCEQEYGGSTQFIDPSGFSRLHAAEQIATAQVTAYLPGDLEVLTRLGRTAEALRIAALQQGAARLEALIAIYHSLDGKDEASKVIDEMVRVACSDAHSLEYDARTVQPREKLAGLLAEQGRLDSAHNIAIACADGNEARREYVSKAMGAIMRVLLKRNLIEEAAVTARKIIDTMESPTQYDIEESAELLLSLADDARLVGASEIANSLLDKAASLDYRFEESTSAFYVDMRVRMLDMMACAYKRFGRIDASAAARNEAIETTERALDTAELFSHDWHMLFSRYLKLLHSDDRHDEALRLWRRFRLPGSSFCISVIVGIARSLHAAGRVDDALAIVDMARAAAIEEGAISFVVVAFAELGRLDRAAECIRAITDTAVRVRCRGEIVRQLIREARCHDATAFLDGAPEDSEDVAVWAELATALNARQDATSADALFNTAQQSAAEIKYQGGRMGALRALARELIKAQRTNAATSIVASLEREFSTPEPDPIHVRAVAALIHFLESSGQEKLAERAGVEARSAAHEIRDTAARAISLLFIAEAYSRMGRYEAETELLAEAAREFAAACSDRVDSWLFVIAALCDVASGALEDGYHLKNRDSATTGFAWEKILSAGMHRGVLYIDSPIRRSVVRYLTHAAARRGCFPVISETDDSERFWYPRVVSYAAELLADDGQFNAAAALLNSVPISRHVIDAWASMAAALARHGGRNESMSLIAQLDRLSRDFPDEDSRRFVKDRVIRASALVGLTEPARESLAHADKFDGDALELLEVLATVDARATREIIKGLLPTLARHTSRAESDHIRRTAVLLLRVGFEADAWRIARELEVDEWLRWVFDSAAEPLASLALSHDDIAHMIGIVGWFRLDWAKSYSKVFS